MGDGQYQVLGYGYDITGEYLARQSIKNEVLDIAGFYAKNPQLYKVEYVGEIKDNFYAGEDYMNYVKDIINKTILVVRLLQKSILKRWGNQHRHLQ